MTFALRLGEEVPDFTCNTTQGTFRFHEFIKRDSDRMPFTVLMSHPHDFTPVCTTELGRAESLFQDFKRRGVKLIGLSCDSLESHKEWTKDILYREKKEDQDALSYPVIADESREIATGMGMLDPRTATQGSQAAPARALIVIDKECKVRLAILYPASTGRSFDEVFRVLDSLNIVEAYSVATPVDWKPGDRVIVPPNVPSSKFKDVQAEKLPSGKEYLRFTGL